ncbi:MAG: glycosyltransferase [Blautia sp.]|nr:glycosyltransferase [Blautia sp.]
MSRFDFEGEKVRYIFCCTMVPIEYEMEIADISNASNRFLHNLCTRLMNLQEINIMSYLGIPVMPEVRKKLYDFSKQTGNFFLFYKSRMMLGGVWKYGKALQKQLRFCDGVIAYNVLYVWLRVPDYAKKLGKKSILILADYSPPDSYKSKVRKAYAHMQLKSIRKYECVIGLSENVKQYLRPTQRFMCMEGGINREVYDYFVKYKTPDKKHIKVMYAGILEKVTGIDLLIRAFETLCMENVQLIISGKGSLAEWLRAKTEQNQAIIYLGCVPYEEYIYNLSEADILVNPRNMALLENAYNFPSKIMEYLATGKPIVSTRFPGWQKYDRYISFCGSTVKDIQEAVFQAVENIEKWDAEKYRKNREFAKNFIWDKQVETIAKFMEEH